MKFLLFLVSLALFGQNTDFTQPPAPIRGPCLATQVWVQGWDGNMHCIAGFDRLAAFPTPQPIRVTSLPAYCITGYIVSLTTGDRGIYFCYPDNTWTKLGSGGGAWGTIIGTISNQTDLNNALVARALIAATNTFTRGQIINGSQDELQFDITCNLTQTNPCFRIRKNDGTILIQATDDGTVQVGSGAGPITLTNQSAPSTPASGKTAMWVDSTDKNGQFKDDAGNISSAVRGITNPSDTQVVNYISKDGVQHRISQSGGSTTDSLFLGFGVCADATALNAGRWGAPSGGMTAGLQCLASSITSNPALQVWNNTTDLGKEAWANFTLPNNLNTGVAPIFRIKVLGLLGSTGNIKLSTKIACQADDSLGSASLTWSSAATTEIAYPATATIKAASMTLAWPAGCDVNKIIVLSLTRVAASSSEYGANAILFNGSFSYGVQ